MSSSNSVLRRYTPPTCTLEITAAGSPLSRWIGRPAIKQLQFQLSLDDPRLPEEKRLTLKGDKTQLEALREAVETYVQDLLGQSPAAADTALQLHPEAPSANLVLDTTNDETTVVPATSPEETAAVESGEAALAALPPTPLPGLPGNIYLQPDGILAHNLYLGSLATPESGAVVRLSTLQLFDLATAFEQYADDLVVLPNLKSGKKKGFATKLKNPPVWAKTAAGLVLAAGATAAGVQLLNRNTSIQTADAPQANPNPTPTEQPIVAGIPSPSPTLVVPTPPLSSAPILPTPTLGALASPSPNASPPLGTGVTPNPATPSPPLGTGATPSPATPSPPLGSGATPNPATPSPPLRAGATPSPATPSPPLGIGVTPSPATPSPPLRAGVPPRPNAPSLPSSRSPAAGSSPNSSYKVPGLQFDAPSPTTAPTPLPTQPPLRQNDATQGQGSLPQGASRSVPKAASRRVAQPRSRPSPSPAMTIPPDPVATPTDRVTERLDRPTTRRDRTAVRSTPTPNPTFFPRPDVTPKATASPARVPGAIPAPIVRAPAALPTPVFDTPRTIPTPTIPPRPPIPTPDFPSPTAIPTPDFPSPTAIPTPMAAAPAIIPTPTPRATTPDPSVAALRSSPTPKPEANPSPATDRDNTSAVFDPIPQVAEVRRYFQQRWQPPSTLTQDIEYTLSLNPDGSIKTVTPRGQTAEIYLDRTEMPLVGEPFVSPIEGGRNTTIILVLSKDGKVQAFLLPSN